MKKNKLLFIFLAALLIIGGLIVYNFYTVNFFSISKNTFTLKINIDNKTHSKISELKITSNGLESAVELPMIPAQSKYGKRIVSTKEFSEGNIIMTYNNQQICLEGYIEHGYRGTVNVTINSVNSDGTIKVTVEK